MRITTTAHDTAIVVLSMVPINTASITPATEFDSDETKLFDGKPAFPLRDVVISVDGRLAKGASLKVKALPDTIPAMTPMTLTGRVEITPYLPNGGRSISYSIVADGLAPAPSESKKD